jgi:hypothetical protein
MVRLTRPRHPFDGQQLPVLGSMRRHGVRELLVVLPDGSKRLIPAIWTPGTARIGVTARGRWGRWRTCWACPCWFRLLAPRAGRTGSRLHESHRPRRTIVQAVQLSLLPDQVPAPLPDLTGQLPGLQVQAAVTLLAGLIARTRAAAAAGEARDE